MLCDVRWIAGEKRKVWNVDFDFVRSSSGFPGDKEVSRE